jgi:hypothetical protein
MTQLYSCGVNLAKFLERCCPSRGRVSPLLISRSEAGATPLALGQFLGLVWRAAFRVCVERYRRKREWPQG